MAVEFSCKDAGASCGWHTRAHSEEELLAKVERHLKDVHRVKKVTNTLKRFALSVARGRGR